ncbi:MAG: transglycosylase SLT domain-containing protein [Bacilli bacterium]|nr:transglycosylase SLT domain-containing protein [Bacilli bacterium]
MSKYVVSYYDTDGRISLTEKSSDVINNVLAFDQEISAKIKSLISLDDCVVKFDENKKLVILENSQADIKIVFRFCEEILELPELADIKEAIVQNCEKNGAIDITEREIISQTPTRSANRNGLSVKSALAFLLVPAVLLTGFKLIKLTDRTTDEAEKGQEPSSVYVETLLPTNKPIDVDDLIKKELAMRELGSESVAPIQVSLSAAYKNPDEGKRLEKAAEVSTIEETETNSNEESVMEEVHHKDEPIESIINYGEDQVETQEEPQPISKSTSMYLEFPDESDTNKAIKCKELYYDIIMKYSHKYGLDPNLVLGMATQERGIHSSEIDSGGGIGLMQVQYSVWVNQQISFYELNEETGKYEKKTMTITDEKLRDVETNIQIGCLILQDCLINSHYNIPIAVQMYNMGLGEIYNMLDNYRATKGCSRSDILDNPEDIGWLDYRISRYLEAINKWIYDNNYTVVNVKTGEVINIEFTNENEVAIHSR